jgi:hypothetical protein
MSEPTATRKRIEVHSGGGVYLLEEAPHDQDAATKKLKDNQGHGASQSEEDPAVLIKRKRTMQDPRLAKRQSRK